LDIAIEKKNKELIKILTLHEIKFKEFVKKTSIDSINIYNVLIDTIGEKVIVKDIINMKNELELK